MRSSACARGVPWPEVGATLGRTGLTATQIGAAFATAHSYLVEASASVIIGSLFHSSTPSVRQSVLGRVVGVDHVGFLLPPEAEAEDLPTLAAEAGFPMGPTWVPSVILAREFGVMMGVETLPMRIFKARSREGLGVEAFVPRAPKALVKKWIRRGLGVHVGLLVPSVPDLEAIQTLLEGDGFASPSFMNGRPMGNEAEGSVASYFDLLVDGELHRVEFYYRRPLAAPRG